MVITIMLRYEEGKEYPIHCRKKETLEAEEEVILNVNELAEGHSYFQVRGLSVSPQTIAIWLLEWTKSAVEFTRFTSRIWKRERF